MKKIIAIIISLVVLLTQCKPDDDHTTNQGVKMTLTASFENKRTEFNAHRPSWSDTKTETVYVVTNGKCVGSLTNTVGSNTFTGTISNLSTGTYTFHYYYVGNQNIATNATSFSMSIANQSGKQEDLGNHHIGYGKQEGLFVTSGQAIIGAEAEMRSLTSIAYFNIAGMAEIGEKVYLYGEKINDKFTVNFSDNTPIFEQTDSSTDNYICAGTIYNKTSNPVYIMLLPNDGSATDITLVSKRTTGECNGLLKKGIQANNFYCGESINSPITFDVNEYFQGSLRGVFSVSASKKVLFSQGNLQADTEYAGTLPAGSTYGGYNSVKSWQFATNQYDMVGTGGANKTVGKSGSAGLFDLFSWSIIRAASDGVSKSRWGIHNASNTGLYSSPSGFLDWGQNNISNGGNVTGKWHTLTGGGSYGSATTGGEWHYITNSRSSVSSRYLKAKVCDINGLILFPDTFKLPAGLSTNNINTATLQYTNAESYNEEQWAMMEAAGAVFLPIGYTRTTNTVSSASTTGLYRTATLGNKYNYSFLLNITDTNMTPSFCSTTTWANSNCHGYFVRLVIDIKKL